MYEEVYREFNNVREDIIKEILHNMDINEQAFKDWINNINKNVNSVPLPQREEIYNKLMTALVNTNIISRRKYR